MTRVPITRREQNPIVAVSVAIEAYGPECCPAYSPVLQDCATALDHHFCYAQASFPIPNQLRSTKTFR